MTIDRFSLGKSFDLIYRALCGCELVDSISDKNGWLPYCCDISARYVEELLASLLLYLIYNTRHGLMLPYYTKKIYHRVG
ncbi:Uu.00g122960.m01.CDS01 [Anthostomella pinea]|uniref:Uu.00g122960.m01.CDS01 n=1 Tax=Anthostomella pinea TaxID=933095 RepID=A0AAI8VHB8_9PEZI|nr:Uu.00g122960.m01.CDS01 [Anthostomella pinea]